MERKSSKKSTPRAVDGNLIDAIRNLRNSFGMNQKDFARKFFGATQTQISDWERGSESPSNEKLVMMANIAKELDDQKFFLRRAGVSEKLLKEHFPLELKASVVRPDESLAFKVPIAKKVFLGSAGELQTETEGSLLLPSGLIANPTSVFCMRVPEDEGIPSLFAPGDYVIIERLLGDLDDMVGAIVAVGIENYQNPNLPDMVRFQQIAKTAMAVSEEDQRSLQKRWRKNDSLNRKANPKAAAESDEQNEERWKKAWKDAPLTMKFGWLKVQPAGGAEERNIPWESRVRRISLDTSQSCPGYSVPCIPLGDWVIGIDPSKPNVAAHISFSVHFAGRIIGWFRGNLSQPMKDSRVEN